MKELMTDGPLEQPDLQSGSRSVLKQTVLSKAVSEISTCLVPPALPAPQKSHSADESKLF